MGGSQSPRKKDENSGRSNFEESKGQEESKPIEPKVPERELNEAKKEYITNTVTIFVTMKIRVKRIPELENNFKGFRAYWEEEIQKKIDDLGEIKVINVIT